MSRDLDDFLSDITWFFRYPDEIKVIGERTFHCSNEFENKFPMLTKLLKKARITILQYEDKRYELFGWSNLEYNSLGWLCFEPLESTKIMKPLHPDHFLLLQNFGGITERWNEPLGTWLLNLHYALPYEYSEVGFSGWEEPFWSIVKMKGLK